MSKEKKVEKEQEKQQEKEVSKLDDLQNQIDKLNEEVSSWKDKYYRAYADLDNQRKLYQKEYATSVKYSAMTVVEKILPSIDIFASVIGSADKLPNEVKSYVMGFDLVYRQLMQALESEGVTEISCKIGDKFNHEIHYAMDTEEVSDEKDIDTIVKIYHKGYKLHDRLIRPVAVTVGAKKSIKEEDKEEQSAEKDNEAMENTQA